MSLSSTTFPVLTDADSPESSEEMEIPGFPKAPKSKHRVGFAANLHGHLEKLAANATSISHVLEALCGGLDRLEHKVDANASEMAARLANIVHHVTGEADEDTMSAWENINLGSPVGDNSVARRRGSFTLGLQGASFSGDSRFELDEIGEDNSGSETRELDSLTSQTEAVVPKVLEATKAADEPAEKSKGYEDLTRSKCNLIVIANSSATMAGVPGGKNKDVVPEEEQAVTKPNKGILASSDHRRSNQDDQSQGSEYINFEENENENDVSPVDKVGPSKSARLSDDEAGFFNQPANAAKTGEGQIDLEESIGSASDWHYIAQQRWLWAFGRVCHLLRRRKRKQLEIMTQRATDRTVRMGSRVSIMEKRLDETRDAFIKMERLRAKNTTHSCEIKNLNAKVAELSALIGVEDRVKGFVQVTQAHVEGMLQTGHVDVEAKLRSGHDELELRLESAIRQHGSRLEDLDDQYARSEEAVRHAQDRLGDVQEEVNTATQSIVELERQLRVDEERLDSLELAKKVQQQRLSELGQKVGEGGVQPGVGADNDLSIEHEAPEEIATERMTRLLKAAAIGLELLTVDLDKIVDRAEADLTTSVVAASNFDSEHTGGDHVTKHDKSTMIERLKVISNEAAEYADRCRRNNWIEQDGELEPVGSPGVCAEALCARIEGVLSLAKKAGGGINPYFLQLTGAKGAGDRRLRQSSSSGFGGFSLDDIQCTSGYCDLTARLKAARDVMLPIVEEQTSLGSLKVSLLGLQIDLEQAVGGAIGIRRLEGSEERSENDGAAGSRDESRWQGIYDELSVLNAAFAEMKETNNQRDVEADSARAAVAGINVMDNEDLEERFLVKADISWVQRELQRLWEALNSHALAAIASNSTTSSSRSPALRSASVLPHKGPSKENPETAGEESDSSRPSTPVTRVVGAANICGGYGEAGGGGGKVVLPYGDTTSRLSFHEGSPLIKDLLRKTSRLDQQMLSKADNEEVMSALSSIGNKLRKISSTIPGLQDAISNKVERKDLTKLAALISHGGGEDSNNDENNPDEIPAVLASRLNSKFRCLSCDRPLPTIGPPGPPKFGLKDGLALNGSGTPSSPQRYRKPGVRGATPEGGIGASSRPRSGSPANISSLCADTGGDVVGWGGGSSTRATTPPGTVDCSVDVLGSPSTGQTSVSCKRRDVGHGVTENQYHHPPGRLDPIGPNAPGEQIVGVMSRYPRMMPPPSRIRTAAGGGGAGIGSRPGSSGGF